VPFLYLRSSVSHGSRLQQLLPSRYGSVRPKFLYYCTLLATSKGLKINAIVASVCWGLINSADLELSMRSMPSVERSANSRTCQLGYLLFDALGRVPFQIPAWRTAEMRRQRLSARLRLDGNVEVKFNFLVLVMDRVVRPDQNGAERVGSCGQVITGVNGDDDNPDGDQDSANLGH
jgi:hypothetical protein